MLNNQCSRDTNTHFFTFLLVVFFLPPAFLAPFLAVFVLLVLLAGFEAAPSAALGALFLMALDLVAFLVDLDAFLETLPFAILIC